MPDLRVLHVLDHSLPVVSGYSIRSHAILRAQRNAGIDPVALTSPKQGGADRGDVIDDIGYLRVAGRIDGSLGAPLIGESRLMRRVARRVARELVSRQIAVLHAHSPVLNGLPCLWVGRRAGIPVVYEVRAPWEEAAVDSGKHTERSPRYRTIRMLESWMLRRADAVVAISMQLAEAVVSRGVTRSKVFHVPNGVDVANFMPMAADEALRRAHGLEGKVVFGFVGGFNRYEGLDILVRAFAILAARAPQARLLLVGDGPAKAAVCAEVRRLGLAAQVVVAGPVAYADVRRWYSLCDVLVYPRRASRLTELTTPLKPLEAMAMGKIVVGSDVGGLRELIRAGETGLLFRPGDAEALGHLLGDVTQQLHSRSVLGEAARRWVCAERDWWQLTPIYARAYQFALQAAGAQSRGGVPERAAGLGV
jgi:glycogen synthase